MLSVLPTYLDKFNFETDVGYQTAEQFVQFLSSNHDKLDVVLLCVFILSCNSLREYLEEYEIFDRLRL